MPGLPLLWKKWFFLIFFFNLSPVQGIRFLLCLLSWTPFNNYAQGCHRAACFDLCLLISWGMEWVRLLDVGSNPYFGRWDNAGILELALDFLRQRREQALRSEKRWSGVPQKWETKSWLLDVWHGRDPWLRNMLFTPLLTRAKIEELLRHALRCCWLKSR